MPLSTETSGKRQLASKRLLIEYKQMIAKPVQGIIAGPVDETNLFHWLVTLSGPEDTPFEGGVYEADVRFPPDYPLKPFSMRFKDPHLIYHPNIYENGDVCISILHNPGDDPNHYESADERWSPIQNVETVMISIISMLAEPNDESPANIEAAKMWREDRAAYNALVCKKVKQSLGIL